MQNSMVTFTFCFILEAPFLENEGKQRAIIVPTTLRDLQPWYLDFEIGSTAFLFCCGECVRGTALKVFK